MAGVTVLVLFASCGNSNKTDADPFASITHLVDSAMVNKTDSIDREKTSDEPKPIEADESFDDFIYNFASDDALQRQRVVFPLPYYNGLRKSTGSTGSMMTCLPNKVIIPYSSTGKRIWIW